MRRRCPTEVGHQLGVAPQVRASLVDERFEEALVLLHLGMPEHGYREALVGILEPFERAVLRPRGLDEALPHPADSLVVARLHAVVALAEDLGEPRAALHLDGMLGERSEHLPVPLVPDALGQMLDEVAAAEDVEELETAADRKRRHVTLERPLEEGELACVTVGLRRVGRRVPLCAVRRGVDVDAPGEDDPVEHVEGLVNRIGARWHDERSSAGPLHGLDVVKRYERGGQLPCAPAGGLGVRGDADQRTRGQRRHASGASAGAWLKPGTIRTAATACRREGPPRAPRARHR